MLIKNILTLDLIPDPKNPRKDLQPEDPEYQKIKTSIEKFGDLEPIVFNTKTRQVVGGHQRLKIFKASGQVSLHVLELGAYSWAFTDDELKELSPDEEKAANVALNKAQGVWDDTKLVSILEELKGKDLLLPTGFDEKEFNDLLRELHKNDKPQDTEPQISRADELRKEWGTETGQLWQCGDHRILCGDCTELTNVNKLMGGERADLVISSPPYWNQREYSHWDTFDEYMGDMVQLWGILKDALAEGGILFWNIGDDSASHRHISAHHSVAIEKAGFTYIDSIIWKKQGVTGIRLAHQKLNNKYYPGFCFEPLLVFQKPGGDFPTFELGANVPLTNVWEISTESNPGKTHSAPFPVKIPATAASCYSSKGAVVLDPFLGSGTTMIACENLERKCRGMEIDPGYVAVCLQRYKDTFPDKEIQLIADNSG